MTPPTSGRQPGAIRQALATAAAELVEQRGAVTWRELATHAQVSWRDACTTSANMVRAGDLIVVGQHKPAHSIKWMRLLEPGKR